MELQPLLHNLVAAVHAPWQAWSGPTGIITPVGAQGVYFGDTRILDALDIRVDGHVAENISGSFTEVGSAKFVSLPRRSDGPGADPTLRLDHERVASATGMTETLTLSNATNKPLSLTLEIAVRSDLASMDQIKQGRPSAPIKPTVADATIHLVAQNTQAAVTGAGAQIRIEAETAVYLWHVTIPSGSNVTHSLEITASQTHAVVEPADCNAFGKNFEVTATDPRLTKYIDQSLVDLKGLFMRHTEVPEGKFLAAGAPWFFTLFGRDSLIAARMLLPLGTDLAFGTLKTLAHLQGTVVDLATAQEPGKILHEVRAQPLDLGENDIHLPPLYYGSVDSTALWVILLHEAWTWGLPKAQVKELLPHLLRAMEWMDKYADSDGDGFFEYFDAQGRGLANQGWKDSGDSIQWANGELAQGPIALVEVQGYAHKAALGAAEIFEAFDLPQAQYWRNWAANLKELFRQKFWVQRDGLCYPAIALDFNKEPVDSLTSNIGHLLGTGILTPNEEQTIASLLVSEAMNSGYGLRTLSSDNAGYWPLSYHGGSVWAHDTALSIKGLAESGFGKEAATLSRGLLRTAQDFDYRVPELQAGNSRQETSTAIPYPAACRPQAWSAASSIAIMTAALGLKPNAHSGGPLVSQANGSDLGALKVSGIHYGHERLTVAIDNSGNGSVTKL